MIVALTGATGLTGSLCLEQLLAQNEVKKVYTIGRRPTGASHAKLTELVLTNNQLADPPVADAYICCLGTTIRKAGSKQAFKDVDLHLPVKLAYQLRDKGCETAAVVSAMGANANAKIFYSQVKGEMEAGMRLVGFKSLSILRPSFINGQRNEKRLGETLGIIVFNLLQPLMRGRLKNYKPVSAQVLARALVRLILDSPPGTNVYMTEKIKKLAE